MSKALDPRIKQIWRISGTFILLMWIAKRRALQLFQPFGLTPPQFMTLAALSVHQQAYKMSDLTNITLHDPPTMTGIINRLVNMGLVERSHSQIDRRVVLVQATLSGINLIKQIHADLLDESTAVYQILSDQELNELERIFANVLRHVAKCMSVEGTDLAAALNGLESFMCDPAMHLPQIP